VAVLGHLAFAFENLDHDTWLVVSVCSEGLGLLGWNGGVSLDQNSHHTTSSLDTLRQGGNIEEEQVLDGSITFTAEDGTLDGSAEGDGLIGVDGSVKLLSIEEIREHLLDLGDTGGATDEHNFVNLTLADVGILEYILNGRHALSEEVNAEFFEFSTGNSSAKVLTLVEGFALNFSLMG
jgi:hypothetical protein